MAQIHVMAQLAGSGYIWLKRYDQPGFRTVEEAIKWTNKILLKNKLPDPHSKYSPSEIVKIILIGSAEMYPVEQQIVR